MPEPVGYSTHGVALIAGRYELIRELGGTEQTLQWEAFDCELERGVLVEFPRQELADFPKGVERFWQQARASARASTVAGDRVLNAGTDPETGRVFIVREWSNREVAASVAHHAPERVFRSLPPWPSNNRRLAVFGVVLVLGLAAVMLRPGVDGWLAWVNAPLGSVSSQFVLGPVPKSPEVGAQPGAAAPTPAEAVAKPVIAVAPTSAARSSTPAPAATPRTTPTAADGVLRRIINTDGRGVALRASPGGDRLPGKGYDEGATVSAFETSGQWTHIRGMDGREGWVLTVTLGPITP